MKDSVWRSSLVNSSNARPKPLRASGWDTPGKSLLQRFASRKDDTLAKTLSRVGLRCQARDFRLWRPRRLTRRLDEAYARRRLTHGKSTVSDGLEHQRRKDSREYVAVPAALRSGIELVPKVGAL